MLSLLKKNYLIFLILLLALFLRLWGISYGLPGLFIGDEKSLVGGALKMIFEKNIFPVLEQDVFRLLYYPTFIPWVYLIFFAPYVIFVYLTGDFGSLAELRDFFVMEPAVFFLIARIINVLFSTAAVFLIYLIAKKIFSKRAGLMAALLYGVSFLPFHQGHFSKHWNFGIFFALLIVSFSFSFFKNPKTKNYLLGSLAVGLAFFSDYVMAVYGSLAVLIHFLLPGQSFGRKFFSKKLWLFIVISLIISVSAILVYPQEFYRMAFGEDSGQNPSKEFVPFFDVVFQVFNVLFYLAPFIFILSLFGYLFLFFQNKRIFSLLIFIPLISPFLYYFLFHFEPRYILLFLPVLAIAAGFGLDRIINFLRIKSNIIAGLISLIVIFLPLKNAVMFDKIISQTDTRNLAKNWIEENLPAGSKIITNSWEFNLIRNQECLNQQQLIRNMSLRSRDYVMMSRPFPDSYCVWPLDLIGVLPPNVSEYEYYLIDEYTTRRFGHLGEKLTENAQLIKKFEGSLYNPSDEGPIIFPHERFKDKRLGPIVEIYKLK